MRTISAPSAALICGGDASVAAAIAGSLARFGEPPLAFAAAQHIRIVPLMSVQRYRDASPSLRRLGVDVDAWPVPPAGLFVVEERTVYLRSASPMTVAHEFAHGLDCALGGGVYRSGYDPTIRRSFSGARAFVTPYAATGLDEYFAECMRAFVEVNDPSSPWPRATRERLRHLDRPMYEYLCALFATELGG